MEEFHPLSERMFGRKLSPEEFWKEFEELLLETRKEYLLNPSKQTKRKKYEEMEIIKLTHPYEEPFLVSCYKDSVKLTEEDIDEINKIRGENNV